MEKRVEGYVYIVYGSDRYAKQAIVSANSLRKVTPGAHITVITDRERSNFDVFDDVMIIADMVPDCKEAGKRDGRFEGKFYNIHRAPYDRVFLVDTDTYFLEDCSPLFRLLNFYDFCLTPANSYMPLIDEGDPKSRIEGLIPYNSGIMLFDNNFVSEQIFEATKICYQNDRGIYRTPRMDIYFTAVLTYEGEVRVYSLPPIFNARIGSHMALHGPVKILHGAGKGFIKPEEYEKIGKEINKIKTGRYWNPRTWKLIDETSLHSHT